MSVLLACPDRADVPLPSAISTAVWTRDSENRPGHGRKKRYSTDLMNRYLAPITVVLLLLAGCASQSQVPEVRSVLRSHDDSAAADRFGRGPVRRSHIIKRCRECRRPRRRSLPAVRRRLLPRRPLRRRAASTWAVPRGGAANAEPAAVESLVFRHCSKPVGAPSLVDRAPSLAHGGAAGPVWQSPAGRAWKPVASFLAARAVVGGASCSLVIGKPGRPLWRSLVGWHCGLSWSIVTGSEVRGYAA